MVSLWEGFTATLHLRTINQINCTLSSVQWHHQVDHILGIGCKNIRYLRHEILLVLFVHPTSCFRSLKQSFTWTLSRKLQIFFLLHSGPANWGRKKNGENGLCEIGLLLAHQSRIVLQIKLQTNVSPNM